MSRAALAWILLLSHAACGQDVIEVRGTDQADPRDYGRSAMMAAKVKAEAKPSSPAAFATFAATVDALRPRMTEEVLDEAELHLVFLALGPMRALRDASPDTQLAELGVTVWPTAFEVSAQPGEQPVAYLERVCAAELASECKYYVAEARPVMLAHYAWRRLNLRARSAAAGCVTCKSDPRYAAAIEAFQVSCDQAWQRSTVGSDSAETSDWPTAGEHSTAWSEPLVFSTVGGARLAGEPVAGGQWRQAFEGKRGDRRVLGVYLRPGEKVQVLRAIAQDAAAAGFTELAVVARASSYPYAKREYRVQIGPRAAGVKLRVRDVETVQVFVQAIDATVAAQGATIRL